MKKMNFRLIVLTAILAAGVSLTSCKKDFASVSINEVGSDLGGDVTGDGGSTTESYVWNNNLARAEYNMDITAASGGSFNLMIEDSQGTTVLNQTLVAGQGEDSKSGVTQSGASGDWTIIVTLTDFIGDGSFSISPGN